MKYESEKTFLDIVEKCLIDCRFKTWREVVPDACKEWKSPYRVDLIFWRKDIGFIGVEGKNINSLRSAVKFSDAINQIQDKYRNQTYFNGNIVSRWCIVAPMKVDWISDDGQDLTKEFIKNFIKSRYNISLMEYIPANKIYNWSDSINIDYNTKDSLFIRRDK